MTATCAGCGAVGQAISKISARALYVTLFALTTLLAVLLRDDAEPLLHSVPWAARVGFDPSPAWFGAQAVHRVSLGAFFFFASLSALTAGVADRSDVRDRVVHHGSWTLKFAAWALCMFLPFLLPAPVVHAYVWLARLVGAAWLVVQMVILLDFAYFWSESWANKPHDGWLYGLLASTLALYASAIAGFALLYERYAPRGVPGGCARNAWLVTASLVPCVAFSAFSLHPACKEGSVLPSAVVTAYCAYLTYTALASEPRGYPCGAGGTTHAEPSSSAGPSTAESRVAEWGNVALTTLGLCYSAARAGSSEFFPDDRAGEDLGGAYAELEARGGRGAGEGGASEQPPGSSMEDGLAAREFPSGPVSYSYSFFHAAFAMASGYLAMVLTEWGRAGGEAAEGGARHVVDEGWASVWVKMASVWVTAGLYAWSLAAPALMPDREF
jgi:hypothetical protein